MAERQLTEYFQGKCKDIDVPLAFAGTPFQARVWQALLTVSYGETHSYGDVARQIGHPAAMSAVGAANGRSQISIMAPCHRVSSSSKRRAIHLVGNAAGTANLPAGPSLRGKVSVAGAQASAASR
ncbi:methylated-DNA--[protein]-cysteine S-methyltransferase [Inquilinus ginsengisoli]|uniref:methylated-DNA--[protein]-cysteine S-methyltransferase n=1 Tax=Inquilinus ginsengisoli TaxID=363840 RepID=UPI00286D542C|nr:methylated-DNA--[protein]-cysteine S-methyltransferase [Inquilinus ginsengisoli]